ncbi:MAG: hypothetical protein P794_01935 [Epsilonproteobacteria bacterium (ex Lamellibrachia satsuma)]|nr:MAG: hypothetical protein P794_01935 [Epsilonproteobacteria bacterium (ex Lamellibrachia satsuma)]
MRKIVFAVWVFMSAALLMAGGNAKSNLSRVIDIPAKACKTDKVYIEKDAKLMWQDQAYTDVEDGAYKHEKSVGKAGNWKHAERYCRRLDYAGYADWRLPTADELMHVHRKPGQVFTYFRGRDFWTSTPASKGKNYVIYPVDAYRYEHHISRSNYIRCVRCLHEGDTPTGPAPVK